MVRPMAFIIINDANLTVVSICAFADFGVYVAKPLPCDAKMDQY